MPVDRENADRSEAFHYIPYSMRTAAAKGKISAGSRMPRRKEIELIEKTSRTAKSEAISSPKDPD